MSNRDTLEQKAAALAKQPYLVVITREEMPDGTSVFVLHNPELKGCMAYGATLDDAKSNLAEVREDYILSLLEDGLEVPSPQGTQNQTEVTVSTTSVTAATFNPTDKANHEDDYFGSKDVITYQAANA
jgi:predicted RNase H-like HicB family nuclease